MLEVERPESTFNFYEGLDSKHHFRMFPMCVRQNNKTCALKFT